MNIMAELEMLRKSIDALTLSFPELADDEQLRADVFEGETDITGILAKLVDYSNEAAAMAAAIKARKAEIGARQARYEHKEEAMRSLIQSIMERAGIAKFTLPEATLSLSFRKPAPVITDETILPEECVKLVKKPDMATIKAWVSAGNIPEGVQMSNGQTTLSIRTK